jgi:hypothetical protein
MNICPICGTLAEIHAINNENLNFLITLATENKIDPALSIFRMMWTNIPKIGLTADTREVVDELSKTLVANTQNQLNAILAPMKMFIETFPKIIEKLPDDIRKDVKGEFQETRIRLESEFKTLREATPTFKDTLNAMQTMTNTLSEVTERKMESIKKEVTEKFKETLEEMGFPEPEQLKLLSRLMPATLPLLEELLRFQKVPMDKGLQGELDLIQELQNYYPEDDSQHLGGSGDIDIMSTPRLNGTSLGQRVLIESKKNNSGWKRSFIEQVRTHMQLRGERFAILTVEVMPKSSNNFFIENCSEGMILVTDRSYFNVCYGAVRSALIALQPFLHRDEIDFRKLFAEKKISEAIDEACRYSEWTKKLREKAQRIDTNTKGIIEDVNQLDSHLRRSLQELQARINEAVVQIEATETKPIISRS